MYICHLLIVLKDSKYNVQIFGHCLVVQFEQWLFNIDRLQKDNAFCFLLAHDQVYSTQRLNSSQCNVVCIADWRGYDEERSARRHSIGEGRGVKIRQIRFSPSSI